MPFCRKENPHSRDVKTVLWIGTSLALWEVKGTQTESVIFIVLGIFVIFLSIYLPRRLFKKKYSSEGSFANRQIEREKEELRKSLEEIFVDIQEFSRETLARMDTKIRLLNHLLIQADEKIRRLEAIPSTKSEVAATVPAKEEAKDSAANLPVHTDQAEVPPMQVGEPVQTLSLHEQVYALADRGMGVEVIAQELKIGKGEVNLIMGLRRTATGRPPIPQK